MLSPEAKRPKNIEPNSNDESNVVPESEFIHYLEELIRIHRSTKKIEPDAILIDPRHVIASEKFIAKFKKTFNPRKKFGVGEATNKLSHNEAAGWLELLSAAELGNKAMGFVMIDFEIEKVGSPGEVDASNTGLTPGLIEFHTHVKPRYFNEIDFGDLLTALQFHPFTEGHLANDTAAERLFAIISLTENKKQAHIRFYSHDMRRVKASGTGAYTSGLARFANDVVIDL